MIQAFVNPILITILLVVPGVSQTIEGTMVIMAICNDGILVASDSRAVIAENMVELAYVDEKDKSFEVHDRIIAFAGRSYMWNDPLSKFFQLIPKDGFSSNIENAIHVFIDSVVHNGDKRGLQNFLSQTIILIAGYEGDTPVICKAEKGFQKIVCTESVISNMNVPERTKQLFADCTMEQGIKVMNGIYKSNKLINVGGPIKVWSIDKKSKKPQCLYNCFCFTERSVPEFYSDILQNKVDYQLISPYTDQYLKEYINREIIRIK